MKLIFKLPNKLKPYYKKELSLYQAAMKNSNLNVAWSHLERAHIIGQAFPMTHTYVHWKMLCFGIKIKSSKEIFGQISRLIFGGVKSFVGKIPIGNPGGANVPALKSFPIPLDLQHILTEK